VEVRLSGRWTGRAGRISVGDPGAPSDVGAASTQIPREIDPMGPSRLTDWQIVREIHAVHPDWTVADHIAYLNTQGRDIDPIWVGRWLRNIAADKGR